MHLHAAHTPFTPSPPRVVFGLRTHPPGLLKHTHITTLPHSHQTVPDGNMNSSVNHLTTPGNVPYQAQIGKVAIRTSPPEILSIVSAFFKFCPFMLPMHRLLHLYVSASSYCCFFD